MIKKITVEDLNTSTEGFYMYSAWFKKGYFIFY